MSIIRLDGENLTPEILYRLGYTKCKLEISEIALEKVGKCNGVRVLGC